MTLNIHIEGDAQRVRIYRVDDLEMEEFDSDAFDLQDQEDLERFMENVDALVESGELDLTEEPRIVLGLDPEGIDEMTLSIDEGEEEPLSSDQLTLRNLAATDPLKPILDWEEGAIFYLRSEAGKGFWDFSAEVETPDFSSEAISIGYFDCSGSLDTYDLLRESYFEAVCDTLVPSQLQYDGQNFQQESFDFNPSFIQGSLYRVATDPESGEKLLERLPCPPRIFLDESEEIV